MKRGRNISYRAVLVMMAASCIGCRETVPVISMQNEPSPVAGASLVPQVTALPQGKILLSWQRPLQRGGYSFEMAIRTGNQWSDAREIASGPNLSMFTADLPAVATLPAGDLLAYWELKDARDGDPYATTILTAISTDQGRTWSQALRPYGDALAGQHSFLSWFPSTAGIGLLWLDASERSKVRHAAMGANESIQDQGSIGLRYAALDARGQVMRETFVDPITCECCPTSAAVTEKGPVVVYRGRQDPPGTKASEVRTDRATVRDIYIARMESRGWTKPHLVHADNWVINACPDNGPSVDATGGDVAVAWWTRANDNPQVRMAFSSDSGDTFGRAIRVDSGKGEGQVTVTLLRGGKAAIVGWLEGGQTWARCVAPAGALSLPVPLGPSPRHSRLPRWVLEGDHSVIAVWTAKPGDTPEVRVSRIGF